MDSMDSKLRNSHIDKVLWIDLEMTGLSPNDDLILEVAAIVTDWNFKEIATYEGIVKNKVSVMKERMAMNSSFWDINPNSKVELLKQNQNGKPVKKIEKELLDFIDKNFKSGNPVLLAGNSIHVDRQFIKTKWPKFDARLHYRMLDVSAWKVVFEGKFRKKFVKQGAHRALDDIRGSIIELKYYIAKIK